MKLLVINPNTSAAMTADIRVTVEHVRAVDVQIHVVSPDFGPESLESFYDYSLAAFGICRLLEQSKQEYDGVLIACYGDPGLYAVKETLDCPVLGIAEASISLSLLLGYRFAILAASEKAVPMMSNLVVQYGVSERFAGVWPVGMCVLDAEKEKAETVRRLIEAGGRATDAGAEVLILGCAGMTGMKEQVEQALGVPIIDPVESSYLLLETMARNGLRTSKRGLYQAPTNKTLQKPELLLW